jgi:hypothetical protein
MRILVIGGAGSAAAAIAQRRDVFERMVLADLSPDRARAAIASAGDDERCSGVWEGAGVLGPEACDAVPCLDLLAEHGSPHAVEERDPDAPLASSQGPRTAH